MSIWLSRPPVRAKKKQWEISILIPDQKSDQVNSPFKPTANVMKNRVFMTFSLHVAASFVVPGLQSSEPGSGARGFSLGRGLGINWRQTLAKCGARWQTHADCQHGRNARHTFEKFQRRNFRFFWIWTLDRDYYPLRKRVELKWWLLKTKLL